MSAPIYIYIYVLNVDSFFQFYFYRGFMSSISNTAVYMHVLLSTY